MARTILKLFGGARYANLFRHTMNGTLPQHLLRKRLIKWLVRTFVRF